MVTQPHDRDGTTRRPGTDDPGTGAHSHADQERRDAEHDSADRHGVRRGSRSPGVTPTLSERQQQVIEHLSRGLTVKEVARDLQISPKTVSLHAQAVRVKLHAKNTTHAVTIALRQGIILVLIAGTLWGSQADQLFRARRGGLQSTVRVARSGRIAKRKWSLLS